MAFPAKSVSTATGDPQAAGVTAVSRGVVDLDLVGLPLTRLLMQPFDRGLRSDRVDGAKEAASERRRTC